MLARGCPRSLDRTRAGLRLLILPLIVVTILAAATPVGTLQGHSNRPSGPSGPVTLPMGRGPPAGGTALGPVASRLDPTLHRYVPEQRQHGAAAGVINPLDYYASEPAPMGIADYGVSGPGVGPYLYGTSAVWGMVTLGSIPTVANSSLGGLSAWFAVQLNVMLVFNVSGVDYTYWVQDVVDYNTSSAAIVQYVDNIWNDSQPGSQMYTSSVTGNGSILSTSEGGAYVTVANSALPGASEVRVAAGSSFSLEMATGTVPSGAPAVDFSYSDGQGRVTYDQAVFTWAAGHTVLYGFIVYGGGTNPLGGSYDLELTFGGPGGGHQTTDVASDLTFQLMYLGGNNFEAPTNAFNFGHDTAEGSQNVADSLSPPALGGNLTSTLQSGGGGPAQLYTYGQEGSLNFTGGGAGGSLTVNDVATSYTGEYANLTLSPGWYYVNYTSGGETFHLGICQVTAGAAVHVSAAAPCTGTPPVTNHGNGGGFSFPSTDVLAVVAAAAVVLVAIFVAIRLRSRARPVAGGPFGGGAIMPPPGVGGPPAQGGALGPWPSAPTAPYYPTPPSYGTPYAPLPPPLGVPGLPATPPPVVAPPSVEYCPRCGTAMSVGSALCPRCGLTTAPVPPPTPSSTGPSPPGMGYSYPPAPVPSPGPAAVVFPTPRPSPPGGFCPGCGQPCLTRDPFCAHCGHPVSAPG
jgi:hypothetical protein